MGCLHLDDTLRGLNLVVSRHDSSLASQRRQSWSAGDWYENGNADLLSMPKVGRESRHGLTPQTTTTTDGGVDSPRASIAGSCSMWIPAKNLSPTLGFTKPGHRDEPCGACTATVCKAGVLTGVAWTYLIVCCRRWRSERCTSNNNPNLRSQSRED